MIPARPDEQTLRELIRLLALRQLNACTGGEVVAWAARALEQGADALALRLLAGLPNTPDEYEVDALVGELDKELTLGLPPENQRLQLGALETARDILSGRISLEAGCRRLSRLHLTHPPLVPYKWLLLEDELDLACDRIYGCFADVERRIIEAARELSGEENENP